MIMGHLRAKMPAMMGKQKAQEKMLRNLSDHFSLVQREHHLPVGENPPSLVEQSWRIDRASSHLEKGSEKLQDRKKSVCSLQGHAPSSLIEAAMQETSLMWVGTGTF